jgi:hypothetical protein
VFPRRWKRPGPIAAIVVAVLATSVAAAQTQLTTVPDRQKAELVVYGTYNLAFVKEQRSITLRKGINPLQFGWSGTQLDPSSVRLRATEHPDMIRVRAAIYPPNLDNVVQWEVESELEAVEPMEVSYYIRGLDWNNGYLVWANAHETELSIEGTFALTNASGEDFENASVRLVSGVLQTVPEERVFANGRSDREEIRAGFAGRRMQSAKASADAAAPVVMPPVAMSELFVYDLAPGTVVPNGWTKRVPSVTKPAIPLTVVRRFDGNSVRKLYVFVADEKAGFEKEPLPAGPVRVFRAETDGKQAYVGWTTTELITLGKRVEWDMGADVDVTVKRVRADVRRLGHVFNENGDVAKFDTDETIRLECANRTGSVVTLEIPQSFADRWEILEADADYTRIDANTVKFTIPLKPSESRVVTYRVRHRG